MDVQFDKHLTSSDVICLQETWLEKESNYGGQFELPNFKCHLNSFGDGKGLATYYSSQFSLMQDIAQPNYQMT